MNMTVGMSAAVSSSFTILIDNRPGDHVLWKNEDQTRAVVIQHVDASERIASIRDPETGSSELVSVLELDAHGASEWAAALPHAHLSVLGIRRGDFVFVHPEGQTNGLPLPAVPKIGEVEAWVREAPMTTDGQQLAGWRREMAQIGTDIATKRGGDQIIEEKIRRPRQGEAAFSWCGEVTGVCSSISRVVTILKTGAFSCC